MVTAHFSPFIEIEFDVLQWDTVRFTAYLTIPSPLPGAGRRQIGSETLSPTRLKWSISPNFTIAGTGPAASLSLFLDIANVAIRVDASIRITVLGKSVPGFPVQVHEQWVFPWPKPQIRPIGNAQIAHVVVVMMENRSFDNLAGWLYRDAHNHPPRNIPTTAEPTYKGLEVNRYWNPVRKQDVNLPDDQVPETKRAYVTDRASSFTVPNPDPHEQFRYMNYQLFGTETPKAETKPSMKGFVVDYAGAIAENQSKGVTPKTIMQCYAHDQVPVLSALAKNYAICDRWFASAPCQTWPNRGFMHAGTSCGRVNNLDKDTDDFTPPDPFYYDTKTIFNVLHEVGITWRVYTDSFLPSLTRYQFITQLYNPLLDGHFRGFETFKNDCALGLLPAYSFLEPGFLDRKNDDHPPHDLQRGERFLYEVWKAVSTSPAWQNTLLIVTFDEHGGCYDHVPPPWTAVNPDTSTPQKPFGFNRFGVRVPTILVSPWIEPGTVFRSGSDDKEFDHTSILATLRDWQDLTTHAGSGWLKSKRIAAAPTLTPVLTRTQPRVDMPNIPTPPAPKTLDIDLTMALNPIERSIVAAFMLEALGEKPTPATFKKVAARVARLKTVGDALRATIDRLTLQPPLKAKSKKATPRRRRKK